MVPRRGKKRSRSSLRQRHRNDATDVQLPPQIERIPFSAPWNGAPRDEFSVAAHAWPIEVFEAIYGVLWKAVYKKDPKWARRFHAALMEEVMGSVGSVEEMIERLAAFDHIQKPGRPRGSGEVIPRVLLLRLYDPLLDLVQRGRQGRKRYAPGMLAALQRFWIRWQEGGRIRPRVRQFPTEPVQAALKAGESPRDVAAGIVAAWFGIRDPGNVPKYVQRARRALGHPPLIP